MSKDTDDDLDDDLVDVDVRVRLACIRRILGEVHLRATVRAVRLDTPVSMTNEITQDEFLSLYELASSDRLVPC